MNTVELNFNAYDGGYFIEEAYKTLRTNFLFSGAEIKTVAFTSCDMNEGKTTVSFSLAYSLAELGKSVLFVDADIRESVLAARYANGAGKIGLSSFLSGQASWEDVLYHTQNEKLDVVFAGQTAPNPVELLDSAKLRNFIKQQRENYDYVLVDTPPLGLVIDCAVIAPFCDGTVMVINAGQDKSRDIRGVLTQLEKSGAHVIGAVMNHAQRRVNWLETLTGKPYYRKDYYSKGYYRHTAYDEEPKDGEKADAAPAEVSGAPAEEKNAGGKMASIKNMLSFRKTDKNNK